MINSLGIDIKDDTVAIAYLKPSLKGVLLVDHAVYALEKDRPLKERLTHVRDRVMDFMRQNRINGSTHIFLGIPGNLTIFKDIEFPLAVKENLRATLRYEMEKYVPLPADDILFDYQIVSEDKGKNRLKVLLIVGKKTGITPYIDFSDTLTGGVSGIETQSTGLVNCIAYDQKIQQFESHNKLFELLKTEVTPNLNISRIHLPSPDLIPACGLALKGLWDAPLQINLLPPERQKKPSRLGFYIMIVLIILAILLGIAWGGSHIFRQRLVLKELNTETAHLISEIKNIDRIQGSFKELEDRLDYLNNLQQHHVSALEVLREFTQIIPESAWIQELDFSEKGIQISGYADSASDLIPILESSPIFKDAVFLSTITKDRDGRERFRIGLKISEK